MTRLFGGNNSSRCTSHTVVITGAGGDLGRELAVRLSRQGGPVALVDQDRGRLAATVRVCRNASEAVSAWHVDVTSADDVSRLADAVRIHAGPAHALYNFAGVIHAGLLVDSQMADLEHVIQVDLLGTIACSQAFMPQLVESGHGQLVNVSSAFGLIGVPGYATYSAAKFGVRGFTEALQQEVGHVNVTVSAVYPGAVRTGIMRRGTYASSANPDEIQHKFEDSLARTSAEDAAAQIVKGVARGRRRIVIGADARLVDALVRVAGGGYQRLSRRMGMRQDLDRGDTDVQQVAPR